MSVLTQIALSEKLGSAFVPASRWGTKAMNYPVKMKGKEPLQNQEEEKVQGLQGGKTGSLQSPWSCLYLIFKGSIKIHH